MTPEFYRRIRPFVCALPDSRFVININTMRQLNMPLLAALFLDSSVSEDEPGTCSPSVRLTAIPPGLTLSIRIRR